MSLKQSVTRARVMSDLMFSELNRLRLHAHALAVWQ